MFGSNYKLIKFCSVGVHTVQNLRSVEPSISEYVDMVQYTLQLLLGLKHVVFSGSKLAGAGFLMGASDRVHISMRHQVVRLCVGRGNRGSGKGQL
jgi:hypothetical protein